MGHFTPTPERNLELFKSTSIQDSYKRDAKYRNSIKELKDRLEKQDYGDKFTEKLVNKYTEDNKSANKELSKYMDGKRLVTPKFIKMAKELPIPGTITQEPKTSYSGLIPSSKNPKRFELNINPNGSDLEAPHEYQHIKNSIDGLNETYKDNSHIFKNQGVAKFYKVFQNKQDNHVLDYNNNLLEEEWDANRARTMLPYIHSKDKFGTHEDLKKSFDEAVASQNTYNSRIGAISPYHNHSLRYHMNEETKKKMLDNMKKMGLKYRTPRKYRVKRKGHIDL